VSAVRPRVRPIVSPTNFITRVVSFTV
jgi:hypothetical protein